MASAASRDEGKRSGEKDSGSSKEKGGSSGLPADEAMLLESFFRIEMGLAGKTDAKNLSRLAKSSPEKYYTPWALALTAQLLREARNDPLASLELLAPKLFTSREDAVVYYNAIRARREAEAKKAKDPAVEIPALPNLDLEKVSLASDWVALEASRSLLALGRYNEAIRILDKLGRDSEDFSRVLAAEAGGDAFACQAQWGRARDFFDYALAFHKQWVKKSKEEAPASTDLVRKGGAGAYERIERSILARITLKRDEARRLWETDQFGPGFLLYNEGEFARKKYKDYRYAIAIYDEIIQHFEKSIWGEAARAYRGLCLLELAKLSREEVEAVEAKRIANLMKTELALYEADKEKDGEKSKKSGREAKDKDKDKKNSASKGGSGEDAGLTKYTKSELAARVKEAQRQKEQIPWWPKRGGAGAIAEELVALVKGDGSPGTAADMNAPEPGEANNATPGGASSSTGGSAEKGNPSSSQKNDDDAAGASTATANATKPKPSATAPARGAGETAATITPDAIPSSYQYALFAETRDERLWRRSVAAEKIPIGKEAEKAAFASLQAFIDEQPWGLYRGESKVALAEWAFEQRLDPAEAEARFQSAWAWLEEIEGIDRSLAVYERPDRVRSVTEPPREEVRHDLFGNARENELKPGALVNRRSCNWYLDDLRERSALALGFLSFARGENKAASEWYGKAVAFDKETARLESEGEWSNVKRLRWGAEHGYLYAYPQELSLYDERQRFVLLVGDFHYVTQRFEEAGQIASRLLADEFGKLVSKKRDYPRFLLGACAERKRDNLLALAWYEEVLEEKDGTLTEERAGYAAGRVAVWAKDRETHERGLARLEAASSSRTASEWKYNAMIDLGRYYVLTGKRQAGLKLLAAVPEKAGPQKHVAQIFYQLYTKPLAGVGTGRGETQ